MYEFDKPPDQFASDIEEAFWATVTPEERQLIARDYDARGREALREMVDEQLRDDIAEREAYVTAFVDGLERSLTGSESEEGRG